ncbi:MAG: AMP-binding protein [Myxococcota bacterium]
MTGLGQLLQARAGDERTRPLLVLEDRRVTYAELAERARRIAWGLRRRVPPGTAVAMRVARNDDFAACFFGAMEAGLRVLPLPRGDSDAVVAQKLALAQVEAAVGDVSIGDAFDVAELEGDGALAPLEGEGDPIALLLPTSGTGGRPKIACISHRSALVHARALASERLRLGPSDAVLATLPLCHSFGLRMTLLCALMARSRVLLTHRFDAERSLAIGHDATFIAGVPTMFAAWAETRGQALPRLRYALSAGAPLAEPTRQGAEVRLGAEVRQGYGLTEASFSAIDAPPAAQASGTCGKPSPGVSIRIQGGEIQVRGANLMEGYLDDANATRAIFDGGWLRTGDIGELDDAGRLRVVDRLKDLILCGGHNVVPSQVEQALLAIAGVSAVAVVGPEDARLGQTVVAVIVPEPGIDRSALPANLLELAKAVLPRSHWPRALGFVDALPLGPSRKVLRRVLRRSIEAGELALVPLSRDGSTPG